MSNRLLIRVGLLIGLILIPVSIYFVPEFSAHVYSLFAVLAPLWLPPVLLLIGWPLWLRFVRSQFVMSIPYSTIELKPGPETPKTARAMELIFYSLYHRTEVTPVSEFVFGQVRVPWSFEVYAHENDVRFFVHLPTAQRAAVEARLRSEYHDIDIDQSRDYAREIDFNPLTMRLQMYEYTLAKPDPYPLRTYISHEAEKDRRDVFNELLEDLVRVGKEEHLCISYMIRPHQRTRTSFFEDARDTLHDAAHKEILKLVGTKGDLHAIPASSKRAVDAIESALKKPSFDCGVRAIYIATRPHFDEAYAEKLQNLFEGYDDPDLNSLIAYDPRELVGWPMSEVFVAVPLASMNYLLQLFRRRVFFSPPYYGKAFVLNTEELATLFHIPYFARASVLAKIRGVRLEPPENLPV